MTGIEDRSQEFGDGDGIEFGFVENVSCPRGGGLFDHHGNAGIGHYDDREVVKRLLSADMLQYIQAAHFGHHQIEQDEIRLESVQTLDALTAVGGDLNLIAAFVQETLAYEPHHRVVFNDQDLFHRRSPAIGDGDGHLRSRPGLGQAWA